MDDRAGLVSLLQLSGKFWTVEDAGPYNGGMLLVERKGKIPPGSRGIYPSSICGVAATRAMRPQALRGLGPLLFVLF